MKLTDEQRAAFLLEKINKRIKLWKKIWKKSLVFFEEVAMYFCAVAGVLLSRYIPMARNILFEKQAVELSWPRGPEFFIACIMAMLVIFAMENKGDLAGKRRNLKRRIFASIANGAMWYTLIGS